MEYLAERRLGALSGGELQQGASGTGKPIRFDLLVWTSLFRVWIWQDLTCFTKE